MPKTYDPDRISDLLDLVRRLDEETKGDSDHEDYEEYSNALDDLQEALGWGDYDGIDVSTLDAAADDLIEGVTQVPEMPEEIRRSRSKKTTKKTSSKKVSKPSAKQATAKKTVKKTTAKKVLKTPKSHAQTIAAVKAEKQFQKDRLAKAKRKLKDLKAAKKLSKKVVKKARA